MSRHWQAGDNIETYQFFIAQILLDFIVLIPVIFLSSPPPPQKKYRVTSLLLLKKLKFLFVSLHSVQAASKLNTCFYKFSINTL